MIATLALLAASALADDAPRLTSLQYAQRFDLRAGDEGDQEAMRRCLDAWTNHPFGPNGPYKARWIETNVRVTGIGGETTDDAVTDYPQLIFVKPAVNVMTKTTLELLNPNGWYCIESNVTVMGKMVIRAHCDAHVADSRSGATVLGANESDGGVTVLGSTRVEMVGCGN